MSFEIFYKENGTQLWVVSSGILTIGEIETSWSKRIEDADRFRKVQFMIADYSNASFQLLSQKDAERESYWPRRAAHINPNITLISILPGDLEFGLARMWGAYSDSDDFPWEMIFVRTHVECYRVLSDKLSSENGDL